MPAFKRPTLPQGPLSELIDALHELHLAAGHPSSRVLADDLETAAVSHTTIHKVFTAGTLPSWGVVEVLTEVLARRARRDQRSEIERVSGLWGRAADKREGKIADTGTVKGKSVRRTLFMSEIMPDILNELEAVGAKETVKNFRIPTGFADLDALTGGWSPGALIIIGGRPSSGKTSLMLNFATTTAIRERISSMFVSVEEDARKLQLRILSAQARIPFYILRTGQMSDDDWSRTAKTMSSIADAPLAINSSTDLTLNQVSDEATRLSAEYGLRVACIDGISSFIDFDHENYSYSLESCLRALKALALKLAIPVIASVQSNRPKQGNNKAALDNMTGGDIIEQIADVMVMLERPDQDETESPRAGEADLVVIKNRFGPQATITVAFQGHYSRFIDMATTYQSFTEEQLRQGPDNGDTGTSKSDRGPWPNPS